MRKDNDSDAVPPSIIGISPCVRCTPTLPQCSGYIPFARSWRLPAFITADHVAVVVLEVTDASCDAVTPLPVSCVHPPCVICTPP